MKKSFNDYQKLLERAGDKEQKRQDYLQIIDKFYNENIIQIENSEEPIQGKKKLKELEKQNFEKIKGSKNTSQECHNR